jgi:hypothetical protein
VEQKFFCCFFFKKSIARLTSLSRRAVIAAGLVSTLPTKARAGTARLATQLIAAIRTSMQAGPSGPVLLNSFITASGPNKSDFDTTQANAAYVYDNALAGLALLAAGDHANAARIGAALEIAQSHDRFYKDGRLRNAYQAGAMTTPAKLPGWWDAKTNRWNEDSYQIGSQTGPIAWAMLLWAALGQKDAANRAGDFLDDQLRAATGYDGGFYGFEPAPLKLTWQSTEQNTDLVPAFSKLGRTEDAAHAKTFVTAMFDPAAGMFDAGTGPDGLKNPLLAADAGTWPYLAGLGSAASARAAIARLSHGAGIGFSVASGGIWLEGTAFAALVLEKLNDDRAQNFAETIAANISLAGYVYATVDEKLATGLTVGPSLQPGVAPEKFNYYRRPALAPTAWAALAALDVNPLAR